MRSSARDHNHRASHERALLVGIALLILLGTLPVFAHHLPLPGLTQLGEMERLGAVCLVALHLALAPVHGGVHVLLLIGVAYALFDRIRATIRLKRGLAALELSPPAPGSRLALIAMEMGVPPSRVLLASEPGNPAFTFGAFKPTICISESLVARLSDAELRCVVAHEACHLARRDPLRLSVLRFLGLTLFWIPALRRLAADVAVDAELVADAAGAGEQPLAMASALISAARERRSFHLAYIAPLVSDDLLAVRVRMLAGERPILRSRITRRAIAGALAALALVWVSGAIVAHPLHAESAERTCLEHSGWPGSHLFCTHYVAGGVPCPHSVASAAGVTHSRH